MENVFNTLADILRPEPAKLNKSLVFKRAWATHRAKIKHGCPSVFANQLKSCYKTAKAIGYQNYKLIS